MSSYGLWLSAAGMKVSDHRQAVLTNNMANANTTGFKQDLAIVSQRPPERLENATPPGLSARFLDALPGGVNVRPSQHDFTQGPIERTDKPLDVAIQGKGFFAVTDGTTTRYTRNGEFARNRAGELVLSAGDGRWKVLSDAGASILLDEEAGPANIRGDGTVRTGDVVVARLGLFEPENYNRLRKVGENLFEATGTEMNPIDTALVPGSREGSNFDVMPGLASMIEVSRAYQLNATMLQIQDQLVGQAVSRIARVA